MQPGHCVFANAPANHTPTNPVRVFNPFLDSTSTGSFWNRIQKRNIAGRRVAHKDQRIGLSVLVEKSVYPRVWQINFAGMFQIEVTSCLHPQETQTGTQHHESARFGQHTPVGTHMRAHTYDHTHDCTHTWHYTYKSSTRKRVEAGKGMSEWWKIEFQLLLRVGCDMTSGRVNSIIQRCVPLDHNTLRQAMCTYMRIMEDSCGHFLDILITCIWMKLGRLPSSPGMYWSVLARHPRYQCRCWRAWRPQTVFASPISGALQSRWPFLMPFE